MLWRRMAMGGAALAAVLLAGWLVLSRKQPPPAPPPASPPPHSTARTAAERLYQARLDEDADRFGLSRVAATQLASPLRRTSELRSLIVMSVGEILDTPHLRLQLRVDPVWNTSQMGRRAAFDHLVLGITNQSEEAVAYRIDTVVEPDDRCKPMGVLPHNAVALAPGEKIDRTECRWSPGLRLRVLAVEVIELPPIGYRYVNRLDPGQLGLDSRTSAGHLAPRHATACIVPRWIDLATAGVTWADVIDFYARHNCEEYGFPAGYRFQTGAAPPR